MVFLNDLNYYFLFSRRIKGIKETTSFHFFGKMMEFKHNPALARRTSQISISNNKSSDFACIARAFFIFLVHFRWRCHCGRHCPALFFGFVINPVINFSYLLTSAVCRYIDIKRYSYGLTGKRVESNWMNHFGNWPWRCKFLFSLTPRCVFAGRESRLNSSAALEFRNGLL